MPKERVVSLTDWHVPFHDVTALNLALDFCEYVQPQIIVIHEAHDFYALSSFDKDPKRLSNLQEEIDTVTMYLGLLRRYCPKARIILLNSNHLDRLRRYLWKQAPALSSLRSLEIENLLELKQHKIEYMEDFEYKGVLYKHGDVVRKFSGYTGKAEFEREGMSGVTGHTHRLCAYYSTKRSGKYVWVESGCLCDLNPEYIKGVANWQTGFSMVTYEKTHYYAEAIPVVGGKIVWGNF